MAEELRELRNNVEIVGMLKTLALEEKQTKKGKTAIMGHLVIEVKDGDNVQNIRVNIYAGKFKNNGEISKLYTADRKIMDEYKDIDTYGRSEADYISVNGNLDGNDYLNNQNVLISTTQVRGVFMSRVDAKQVQPHAWATVETIVNSMRDVEDEDGPTGEKSVEAYTVGYGGNVIQLQNVIIGSDMAEQFEGLYYPGTMGLITMKINNYAVAREEQPSEATQHGFGSTEKVEEAVVHDFVTNLEIIGGELPIDNGTEFTPEEIAQVVELRKQQIATASVPTTNARTSGFENAIPSAAKPSGTPKAEEKAPNPFAATADAKDDDFDAF